MSDQRFYMACLDLRDRSCLVVGGGTIAAEKVKGLLDCEARVTVVAPRIAEAIKKLPVTLQVRAFEPTDLDGQLLVIAATDDRSVNEAVSVAAAARSLLCNVADDPELCSFILPAIVRHDPILVGVSTGGASPALAQRIRSDIAQVVGPEHARLARQLAALRPWAKRTLPTYEERRDYFQALVAKALPLP
jgi:precorrin-2 dehydrogenase/sirohydrochlorin ferrochelatase